jgi:hypothetical protein
MKLKALLLGSATALAVAGSAQAADLSVAEPVDYVRVCDAFGTGYWYIPGTDTCLKIWGFVRWDANYYPESYYHYDFYTAAYIEFSAKSMTDWGPLEAYMGAWQWGFDTAYISLGPLLVGRTTSTFAQAYPWGTRDSAYSNWFQTEHYADQIRLSWAMNGFGVMIALEEPDDNVFDQQDWGYPSAMPDIVAAVTWSNAMMDGKVSFVYSDSLSSWADDNAWAASAGVVLKLDSISPGDKLLLKAAYGNHAAPYVLGDFYAFSNEYYGWMWSAMASFTHFFAPNFSTNITVNYADAEYWSRGAWQGSFNISYSPAPTLWITPEVNWANWGYGDTDWWFRLRIQKVFY